VLENRPRPGPSRPGHETSFYGFDFGLGTYDLGLNGPGLGLGTYDLGLNGPGLGLGTYDLGLNGPGLGLGLESCTDNFLASPSNARKMTKLIIVIITS